MFKRKKKIYRRKTPYSSHALFVLAEKFVKDRTGFMYSPFKKYLLGFPGGSAGKEPVYSAGDLGSIPGLGRSIGEGNGYLLQYSGLENSMDCIVHRVAKSPT